MSKLLLSIITLIFIIQVASAARFFEFTKGTDTFVIKLKDPVLIQQALNIVNGIETEAVSVMGTIVKSARWYNPQWSYHLDPKSIEFFQNAMEMCDANCRIVEDHLAEVGG
eukprot:gene16951-20164_t